MSALTASATLVRRHVLLDFDGPVCAVFGALADHEVADTLRRQLPGTNPTPDTVLAASDPFVVLAHAYQLGTAQARVTELRLTELETSAVANAPPTPHTHAVIRELVDRGHQVTIVSNNSATAVRAYLERHQLTDSIAGIAARVDADPGLLKPNPHLLHEAMRQRTAKPGECVMVGDSATDIEAARAAGVAVIAYANKPGKRAALAKLWPDAIVSDTIELVGIISPRKDDT